MRAGLNRQWSNCVSPRDVREEMVQNMQRIPVAGPWITDREVQYVADAAANGWYTGSTKYHEQFELAFADYLGVRHAVALPSCTSAIHLALAALNVGPGDEVIVPDLTWIASAAPTSYVGAIPVFADVDATTWCLSAESFTATITPRTKAVIPVDLYGGMPDMNAIRKVAHAHGIAVIEDAAEAIGSEFQGRPAGSLGRRRRVQLPWIENDDDGRGGNAGDQRRRNPSPRARVARSRPPARRSGVLQHGGRL